MNAADEITQLTDEHRDGTIYADIEGDLWAPYALGGWVTARWTPFAIINQQAEPGVEYGPYRPVLGPSEARA